MLSRCTSLLQVLWVPLVVWFWVRQTVPVLGEWVLLWGWTQRVVISLRTPGLLKLGVGGALLLCHSIYHTVVKRWGVWHWATSQGRILDLTDLRIIRVCTESTLVVLTIKSVWVSQWGYGLIGFWSLRRRSEKGGLSDSFHFSFDSFGLVKVLGLDSQLFWGIQGLKLNANTLKSLNLFAYDFSLVVVFVLYSKDFIHFQLT